MTSIAHSSQNCTDQDLVKANIDRPIIAHSCNKGNETNHWYILNVNSNSFCITYCSFAGCLKTLAHLSTEALTYQVSPLTQKTNMTWRKGHHLITCHWSDSNNFKPIRKQDWLAAKVRGQWHTCVVHLHQILSGGHTHTHTHFTSARVLLVVRWENKGC